MGLQEEVMVPERWTGSSVRQERLIPGFRSHRMGTPGDSCAS